MNIADRILYLRKSKGISQEELADKVGVSRQAVSKWESEQSMPDVEKIIIMSDYFNVTTDYILKGIEVVENKEEKSKEIVGKVLYIASTALIVIGLLCAIGEWYEKQTMSSIYGSMIIQVVGVFEYFLAKVISKENSSFYVKWLNTIRRKLGSRCNNSGINKHGKNVIEIIIKLVFFRDRSAGLIQSQRIVNVLKEKITCIAGVADIFINKHGRRQFQENAFLGFFFSKSKFFCIFPSPFNRILITASGFDLFNAAKALYRFSCSTITDTHGFLDIIGTRIFRFRTCKLHLAQPPYFYYI